MVTSFLFVTFPRIDTNMTSRIGIIISTTRKGRLGERVANWVRDIGAQRSDLTFEIVDLRDYPLDFFDAELSPRWAPVTGEVANAWLGKLADLDGYVFVTAEYNHSISGPLKNAIDFVGAEAERKPAAFVGYGAVGGARAVEHLRLMAVEMGMVATKSAVHIGMEPMLGLLRENKDFADYPYLAPTVTTMLDELAWYAQALGTARALEAQKSAA